MDDVNSGDVLAQIGNGIHHDLVDGMRALASAEDKQGWFRAQRILIGDLEKGLTDWHTGDLAAAEGQSRFGEVHGRSRNQRRYQAVGKSGHEVGLKYKRWNSAQYRREHGWARGVSADAD